MGCGAGSFLDILKELASKTVAVEPTKSFHHELRAKGHVTYSYCEDAIKEWAGTVDIAVCFAVLEHIENPLQLLKEIYSLLKTNGVLLYSTYSEIRTVNPTTPYPSSTLYNYAIKQGLLLFKWGAVQLRSPEKFYEKRYLNTGLIAVIFMEISDEMAYKLLYEANKELLKNHYDHLCNKLYLEQNVNFRGFRL